MSFRETVDPKILSSNFKSELDLVEMELNKAREVELKLTQLVHEVYQKLEKSFGSNDPEIKQMNRQLREILSLK